MTAMKYDPKKHHRRSIRLPGHDYAQAGAYFVTICTDDRQCLFGRVDNAEMRLNHLGQIADECWRMIPAHFGNVELDAFVIMPNHVHGIIVITDVGVGATHASPLRTRNGPKPRSIGAIIGSYKSGVSKRINEIRATPGPTIWQRDYYEHIIRNDASLDRIRLYIMNNPASWMLDRENPRADCYGQEKEQP